MYDYSGIGELMRTKVFLALGLWHNFKQASLLIWKQFALDFIGPAFHCLFPGREMYPAQACPSDDHLYVHASLVPLLGSKTYGAPDKIKSPRKKL